MHAAPRHGPPTLKFHSLSLFARNGNEAPTCSRVVAFPHTPYVENVVRLVSKGED